MRRESMYILLLLSGFFEISVFFFMNLLDDVLICWVQVINGYF